MATDSFGKGNTPARAALREGDSPGRARLPAVPLADEEDAGL